MARPDSKSPDNNPLYALLEQAREYTLRGMMVSMPGKVTAFDPSTQLAQVECGIQRYHEATDSYHTIPVIENVPVQFAGDSQGWYFYHAVNPGDEGWIHFSQRAIDTWIQSGGPSQPVDFRMFSAEDAVFKPGVRSALKAIPGFVNSGMGMSSYDGSVSIQMDVGSMLLTVGGTVFEISGSSVNIVSGRLTHNGVNVGDSHVHTQGADSDGNRQVPTDPPQ